MLNIKADKSLIEAKLEALLPPSTKLEEAMRYSVLAPGKRIRPLLMLAIARYLDYPFEKLVDVGCAIEFIHAASLVIDDLPCMDDDAVRRNQSTTHKLHGEPVAILAAISLLTRSYDLVAKCDYLQPEARFKLITLFSDTVGPNGLSLGQHIDIASKLMASTEKEISNIHHLKTGVLFLAAAKSACLIIGADSVQEKEIMEYTFHLGMAFQILDDIKDAGIHETSIVSSLGAEKADIQLSYHLEVAMHSISNAKNAFILSQFIDEFFQSDNVLTVQSA